MDDIYLQILKLAKEYTKRNKTWAKIVFNEFDDCIQELCLAALKVLPEYNEARGSLGTFMFSVFKSKMLNELRKSNTQKRKAIVYSTNVLLHNSAYKDICELEDMLPHPTDTSKRIEDKLELETLFNNMDEMGLLYFRDGLNQHEIAKKLGFSHQYISLRILKIKKALEIYKKTGDLKPLQDAKLKPKVKDKIEAYMRENNCSRRTYYRRMKLQGDKKYDK